MTNYPPALENQRRICGEGPLLRAIAWFPVVFVALMLTIKAVTPGGYAWLTREDGVVEWATAIAFAVASVPAFWLSRRLGRNHRPWLAILYWMLGLGLLFAMLEEASWGQRLFHLDVPEYFHTHSTKPEINVHNLRSFPLGLAFIGIGFYGAFSRLLVPARVRRRIPLEVQLLTPRKELVPYFFLTFALYLYYEIVYYTIMLPIGITVRREYDWTGHLITGKDQEPVELLLSIGFLLFVSDNWRRFSLHSKSTG